jgi:hypothetical protein
MNIKILFALASLIFTPALSCADEWIKPGEEALTFGMGVFLQAFDTTLRVDNQSAGAGSDVDLENDLGLTEDQSVFWANLNWRFADRHRFGVSYFNFTRDATAEALEEIEIGDEIYPVGATLTTEFSASIMPFYYAYSFIKKDKHELAGSIGFHWFELSLDVKGSGSISTVGDADADFYASANAPLPLFGVRYDYYVNDRWTASIHGEYFALDLVDDEINFSGSLANIRLSTDYWFTNNFGIGAAINWFDLDAEVDDDNWKGAVDYRYFGPQIYVQARI